MLLKDIDFSSQDSYIYMERYVNTGSPSGFTEKHNVSLPTNPKGLNKTYNLCGLKFIDTIKSEEFGINQGLLRNRDLLVHPDMIFNPENNSLLSYCIEIEPNALSVKPTSSSRTVQLDSGKYTIKLHYDGLIGRISRKIGRKQALAAVEVSQIITTAIDKMILPKKFLFLPETFAKVVYLPYKDGLYERGIVFRDIKPYKKADTIKYLIPAFSLFSEDDKSPEDPTILQQLVEKSTKIPEDFLFDDIISPLVEGYFSLLINCGLQLESHAQNVLFAIGEDFEILGVVHKDAESIGKDISLMKELDIPQDLQINDLSCRRRSDYNYQIMHSFMFDFKMGEYLITPLINNIAAYHDFDRDQLLTKIKDLSNKYIGKLPPDFYPQGQRFSYENIVHDRTKPRPYITNNNPKYR